MIENPSDGRVVIHNDHDSLSIEIPSKKNFAALVSMLVWLGGWVMGEIVALKMIDTSGALSFDNAFIIFWLVGWTFSGGFVFYSILRQLAGKEIIRIQRGSLTIERSVLGLGRNKEYEIYLIKDIGVIPAKRFSDPGGISQVKIPGMAENSLEFSYDGKTIKFAKYTKEAEADMIISRLKSSSYLKNENFSSKNERSY